MVQSRFWVVVSGLAIGLVAAAGGDAKSACKPFEPSGTKTGWTQLATKAMTFGCFPNHRGRDRIVNPGEAVSLIGKFTFCPNFNRALEGEWVQTWVQDKTCAWNKLARLKTESAPLGTFGDGRKNKGGRVYATLPAAAATPGRHRVTMLVEGDHSRANFSVHVWKRGTKAIVTDIDATLTTNDMQMVLAQIADMFGGRYSPTAYKCGKDVIRAYADKGYKIIYLTGRGGFLRRLTTRWMNDHGFPGGAYSFMEWFMVPPSSAVQGDYKGSFLEDLVAKKGIKLEYGYGNAVHDATAYLRGGIPKERIHIIGPHAGTQGTVPITGDYCAHLPVVRALPRVTQP
ncbi:MAG: hypothetical protein HYY84_19350 [Deltaproteobacteria bacterium]|nr:hypothetical protein [Deltaproteobacteria bacterium]